MDPVTVQRAEFFAAENKKITREDMTIKAVFAKAINHLLTENGWWEKALEAESATMGAEADNG